MRWLVLFLLLALPVRAEEVVAGLSQSRVSITANFDGSEILVFGAVRRELPVPRTGQLNVVVTIQGPSTPVTVHRKERLAGIWMNVDAVHVDRAPSFYAVATTGAFREMLSHTEDLRHRVSVRQAIRSVGADVMDSPNFTDALIRIRERAGQYQLLEGAVQLERATLFRTRIRLPANLTEGLYVTRILLTRNGEVVDSYQTSILVTKVGLERFLFVLAHQQPWVYGVLSIVIAALAGWGASAAFRFRRS
jgi:uncharacterized protein (TIGR02186 family)